ncbi:MAG: ABC transporter ATP-binding protein [Proteobacteria bacterium]|nr:MAG: ABC transporter ATP-binding protein [Pseudomonadota bacterium]
MSALNPAIQVELRGITKFFGPVRANESVNLIVRRGSIHAIVGENGAGKSTAMKMLYGQYRPDAGEILVGGVARAWRSPADAIAAGVGMVHQHFMLAETHSALENILLGQHAHAFSGLGKRAARDRLSGLMKTYGLEVNLDAPVGSLAVGVQQRIEILKLLYQDSEVLILDEPTAVLAPAEIEGLFRILREMAAAGKTILLITHKLKEVMALAERATVFRAGRVVADQELKSSSVHALAAAMVGRELSAGPAASRPEARQEIVLEAREVRPRARHSHLKEVSFRLRAGEVLGIAGVEGNGQSELLQLLLDPKHELGEGTLELGGVNIARHSPGALRRAGIALFPEDRLKEGLLLGASLAENYLLGHQRDRAFSRGPFLSLARVREAAGAALKAYDVRPPLLEALAGNLSGGNQQKLVVARELRQRPKLLIAAQPTRGVDIGAIELIHQRIVDLRAEGSAVLLLSSELDEVLKLSDRVLVLFRGRIVAEFSRGAFDETKIGALMAGIGPEDSHDA